MTLGDMAKALNRSPLYVRGLQDRFDLPVVKSDAYSPDCPAARVRDRRGTIARTLAFGKETAPTLVGGFDWCFDVVSGFLRANATRPAAFAADQLRPWF